MTDENGDPNENLISGHAYEIQQNPETIMVESSSMEQETGGISSQHARDIMSTDGYDDELEIKPEPIEVIDEEASKTTSEHAQNILGADGAEDDPAIEDIVEAIEEGESPTITEEEDTGMSDSTMSDKAQRIL